jgi:hypothetical protein
MMHFIGVANANDSRPFLDGLVSTSMTAWIMEPSADAEGKQTCC